MARSTSRPSALTVVDLEPREQQVYRSVLRRGTIAPEEVAGTVGLPPDEGEAVVATLVAAGLLRFTDGLLAATPPESLISTIVEEESRILRQTSERLDGVRALLPRLMADQNTTPGAADRAGLITVAEYEQLMPVLRGLATTSAGALRVLRPDQWRLSSGPEIENWVRSLVEAGWTSRAIYPAVILEEAPDVLARNSRAGEQVRLLAEVPARLAIFDRTAVVMHEDWRANTGPLIVLRQPSVVEAVTMLFDHMWDRALSVPGHGGEGVTVERRATRRMLLDQMVRGAKDEQIARALGLSLRTVRRRIAELLEDLGADSRFQAGVEAVRRGWV